MTTKGMQQSIVIVLIKKVARWIDMVLLYSEASYPGPGDVYIYFRGGYIQYTLPQIDTNSLPLEKSPFPNLLTFSFFVCETYF